ncbi:hypothetical protein Y032_0344g3092 [Ancylostoma ceylanicum]|nr:hypothetical protein Y032_0344g3092 [Ancylostoma ceylanicum]
MLQQILRNHHELSKPQEKGKLVHKNGMQKHVRMSDILLYLVVNSTSKRIVHNQGCYLFDQVSPLHEFILVVGHISTQVLEKVLKGPMSLSFINFRIWERCTSTDESRVHDATTAEDVVVTSEGDDRSPARENDAIDGCTDDLPI